MPNRDIIVVGASAGGVDALAGLVRHLPADLPAAVFVVLHVSAHGPSVLPQILSRRGALPAVHATDGDSIEHGRIYVAPPDRHLLIHRDRIALSSGPRENRHRPAVDVLFRSAARAFGPRVVGAVLSGMLDDGASGLHAIKARGGVGIAQDPDEALFPSMPQSAIEIGAVDLVLPLTDLAAALIRLPSEPVDEAAAPAPSRELELEVAMAESDGGTAAANEHPGTPSTFGCPDCGGTLRELHDGTLLRFRCRIGHAYTANVLLAQQAERLEDALWSALRGLEEQSSLAKRLAQRSQDSGLVLAASRFADQREDADRRAGVIRAALFGDPLPQHADRPTGSGRTGGNGVAVPGLIGPADGPIR